MQSNHYQEMSEEQRKKIHELFDVEDCHAGDLAPDTPMKIFTPKIDNEELRHRRAQQFQEIKK